MRVEWVLLLVVAGCKRDVSEAEVIRMLPVSIEQTGKEVPPEEHKRRIRKILESGGDPAQLVEDLLTAVSKGDAAAVARTLEAGVHPNWQSYRGRRGHALPMAAFAGHEEIVALLLEAGATGTNSAVLAVFAGRQTAVQERRDTPELRARFDRIEKLLEQAR